MRFYVNYVINAINYSWPMALQLRWNPIISYDRFHPVTMRGVWLRYQELRRNIFAKFVSFKETKSSCRISGRHRFAQQIFNFLSVLKEAKEWLKPLIFPNLPFISRSKEYKYILVMTTTVYQGVFYYRWLHNGSDNSFSTFNNF